MKILLVGASGLVGSHVLALALSDPRISKVIAPTRRPLPQHPKLDAIITNFDDLPDDPAIWQVDAAICTLGTTMKSANSKAAFWQVDYVYPLSCATLAKKWGCPTFVLTSALGANPRSPLYYSRVKGKLEQSLIRLSFNSLTLVRPNVISGRDHAPRFAEQALVRVLTLISGILPASWKASPAENIATALLEAAISPTEGVNIIPSSQLA